MGTGALEGKHPQIPDYLGERRADTRPLAGAHVVGPNVCASFSTLRLLTPLATISDTAIITTRPMRERFARRTPRWEGHILSLGMRSSMGTHSS